MAGTRRVRMLVGVSGYRHDGERWPPAGAVIEVPAWEADDLIRGQNAIDAGPPDGEPAPDPEPAPEPVPEIPPGVLAGPSPVAGPPPAAEPKPEPDQVPEPEQAAVEEAAIAPHPSAPKQAWIDYAVQVHGADVHAATAMTKADLMSRYGGRL